MDSMIFYLKNSKLTYIFYLSLSFFLSSLIWFFIIDNLFIFKISSLLLLLFSSYLFFNFSFRKEFLLDKINKEYQSNFKKNILNIYKNEIDQNFFEKLNKLEDFLEKRFPGNSLYKIRVLNTIQKSLNLYISNLEKIKNINSFSENDFSKNIDNYKEQNKKIISYLNKYLEKVIFDYSVNEKIILNISNEMDSHIKIFNKFKEL